MIRTLAEALSKDKIYRLLDDEELLDRLRPRAQIIGRYFAHNLSINSNNMLLSKWEYVKKVLEGLGNIDQHIEWLNNDSQVDLEVELCV